MSWKADAKRRAALKAVSHVRSGMVLGLGSGSTAAEAIRALGDKLRSGELNDIRGVPTSYQAIQEAVKARIPLTTLDEYPDLDLGIDGADQIDGSLNAIKGGGGALLREKIVASCCREWVLIADESKVTDRLGEGQPVILEVHPIAVTPVLRKLKAMGAEAVVRQSSGKLGPVVTDNGNNLVDALFGYIEDPRALNQRLHSVQGLLETGLFIGYADMAYIGTEDSVYKMEK
ncbi:ribose-5-phosphate isomerase RpiA [Candidatus Bathyarchaeota archaeon]|nr:ribose-5-phosphate isomerase RpiA [Candidatus Bathyarchaeota archaeon]